MCSHTTEVELKNSFTFVSFLVDIYVFTDAFINQFINFFLFLFIYCTSLLSTWYFSLYLNDKVLEERGCRKNNKFFLSVLPGTE